ncbi:uncharacterized protein [Antedon mediterranea]|uniref:uncharacterized protein isoform X1 n=1 Tax=Antedon mediterranea TaxID=105859 RepID=UPI003AF695D0
MASEDWISDTIVGFLHSPVWTVPIMTFIEENCIVFDTSEENKFEYTAIHNRYKQLVEYLLESFIEDLQIDATAFVKACQSTDPEASETTVILFEQVMAADNFLIFKTMMVQRNIELELQALRMIQKRNGVMPSAMRPSRPTDCEQAYVDDEEILQKVMKQSEAEYKRQQAEKTVDQNLDKVLATSKEEAERLEREKKKEEDMMKKVIENSIEEHTKQKSIEQMDTENLEKVLKMSISEQEMMMAKTTAAQQTSLKDIPGISTSEKKSSTELKTGKSSSGIKPEASSSKSSPRQQVAPGSSKSSASSKLPTTSKSPPPLSSKSAPSKVQSGSDAAASWLDSARAEAASESTRPVHTYSSQASDAAELKKREAYLKQQRDQLMEMKKKEREKSLNNFSKKEQSKARPQSSRAAKNATAGDVKVKSGNQESEDKKLKMRMALAERLKQEVIQK